ncbi:MAG: hypothetical protein ACK56I_07545, partial [bacterium]
MAFVKVMELLGAVCVAVPRLRRAGLLSGRGAGEANMARVAAARAEKACSQVEAVAESARAESR